MELQSGMKIPAQCVISKYDTRTPALWQRRC